MGNIVDQLDIGFVNLVIIVQITAGDAVSLIKERQRFFIKRTVQTVDLVGRIGNRGRAFDGVGVILEFLTLYQKLETLKVRVGHFPVAVHVDQLADIAGNKIFIAFADLEVGVHVGLDKIPQEILIQA